MKPHLLGVVGARPNFIKMQALWPVLQQMGALDLTLVHTSQHHDWALSQQFLKSSELKPDFFLPVNLENDSQARFGSLMQHFSILMKNIKPNAVLVIGDVDSTLACALVAAKAGVPIVHVEAGLRCFDRSLPEEINRVLVDQLSSLLFTTEESATLNLLKEGISPKKIHFVGNVLIDSLYQSLPHLIPLSCLNQDLISQDALKDKSYLLVTLHRRALIYSEKMLAECLQQLVALSKHWPLVWPVHPHTYQQIQKQNLLEILKDQAIHLIQPVNAIQMLSLLKYAFAVITDSGGLQEEATALNIPCFTVRSSTERPVTIQYGTNSLIPEVTHLYQDVLAGLRNPKQCEKKIPLWDGQAAFRIAQISVSWMNQKYCSPKTALEFA
jgi:UDP-N-acetylglucosamine 2-epimerase (non-hydrolysing)